MKTQIYNLGWGVAIGMVTACAFYDVTFFIRLLRNYV